MKIHEAHGDYSHLKAPAKYTKKCIITILRKCAQHTQMAWQRHQVRLSLTVFLCMSPNFLFLKPRDGPVSMSTGPHMSSNDLARGQWTSWNIFRRKSWFSIFDPYTAANNAGHHVVQRGHEELGDHQSIHRLFSQNVREFLQGDHSCCSQPPVGTKTKVAFSTWASY